MKQNIRQWDAARIIRLLLGIAVSAYAIGHGDPILLLPGGLLLLQGLFNLGCCCTSGCETRTDVQAAYQDIIKPYTPKENQQKEK